MSVYQKANRKWVVDIVYEHPNGSLEPRIRKVSPIQTKRGSEAYEREIRQLLASGQYRKEVQKEVPTLEAFQEVYLGWHSDNRDKPSGLALKRQCLRCYLIPLFRDRKLSTFSVVDEDTLKSHLRRLSRSTYNNAVCTLNGILKVAVRKQILKSVPYKFAVMKRPTTIRPFYDFDELEALLEAAKKNSHSSYLMCLLGAEAGLRRGEMLGLELTDCDFRRGLLNLRQAIWKGEITELKGLEARTVPMTSRLHAALQEHRHLVGPKVFYTREREEAVGTTLRDWIKLAQKGANLRATGGLHILRHTFCSHLAMRGASPVAIQRLAGHKNMSTTMGYMHLAPSEATRAIQLLDGPRPLERHSGGIATSGN